jgi:hypothetical protein
MNDKTVSKSAGGREIRSVLLMGYNGANNTGSEARLLAIVEEVQKVWAKVSGLRYRRSAATS